MRRSTRFILIAILAALIAPASHAGAEPCWATGCNGLVGYIFLPSRYYPGTNRTVHFTLGHQDCTGPVDDRPFGETAPPDVNATVSVAVSGTPVYSAVDISQQLASFRPIDIEQDTNGDGCKVTWTRFPGGMKLDAGAKVRILGYQTFVGQHSDVGTSGAITVNDQLLFALVLVETDR
jgi:hypothetical protein